MTTETFCRQCELFTDRYLAAVAIKDWDGALCALSDWDDHRDERHAQHFGEAAL